MSTTSKMTFISSVLITGGIIGYVHYKQQLDREKLHEGVIRDVERQQMRKIENMYILEKQAELTKRLRNESS